MKRLLLSLLMAVSTLTSLAYDFEAATEDGVTLRYSITNTADLQVEVSSYNGSPSKVTIPEKVNYANRTFSVTSIGESAFHGCSDLTSITIPNSVTSIGPWSFYECTALTSVTIPNGVTSIENLSFYSCSGLTSVTIPNSVTSIGRYAFESCYSLQAVHISDLALWCKISFEDRSSSPLMCAKYLYVNNVKVTDIVIPSSVTSIGSNAFYGYSSLTSVTIPNSVTSIGANAFYGCSGLTSVAIPNSVTSIGYRAFSWCSGLTSVIIGKSVISIGYEAFYRCPIENVYCYAEKVPETDTSAFDEYYAKYAMLHVPEASIDLYKAADQWKDFGTIKALSGDELPISSPQMTDEGARVKKFIEAGRIVILTSGKRYGIDGKNME